MLQLRGYIGNRRMSLLCHSMGNYMLGGAVEMWSTSNPADSTPLFDYVLLAAADEVANRFSTPHNGRLANLKKLGRKKSTYNYDDVLMKVSHIANCDIRLGYDRSAQRDRFELSQLTHTILSIARASRTISAPGQTSRIVRINIIASRPLFALTSLRSWPA